MILDSGGFANAFTCGIRQGGAFELKQATWAYNQAREAAIAGGDTTTARALAAENLHDWFAHMPWSEGRSPVRWSGDYEAYLLEQWRHETFDDFWKQVGIYAAGFYDTIPDIPIVLMSSWYDAYVRSTFENYRGLARSGRRPLQLLMGAGLHGDRNTTFAGDVEFGPRASLGGNVAESWLEFRRRWFDRWLKGVADDAASEPRDAPVPHGRRFWPIRTPQAGSITAANGFRSRTGRRRTASNEISICTQRGGCRKRCQTRRRRL